MIPHRFIYEKTGAKLNLGAANLGAGLSGGFVVDGSLSKTAAGVDAGQKTQMTSIFTAVFALITIVALTWLFEPLPEAVLGAIVIHAVWKLIDFSGFVLLWRTRKIDFALAVAAFLGVILIDILQGIRQGRGFITNVDQSLFQFAHIVKAGKIAVEFNRLNPAASDVYPDINLAGRETLAFLNIEFG